MKPRHDDGRLTLLRGDALTILGSLRPNSVHCCVTSPPYWGLRDYGVEGQHGLEPTPELYIEKMVEVFRKVRRVLREDGTLWLNIGDSYCGGGRGGDINGKSTLIGTQTAQDANKQVGRLEAPPGLKPKDLVGIPWMLAFALRADGWWLRSDIIWAKPNPMPESVTDRPAKSHEYLFLLAKGQFRTRTIEFSDTQPERVHFGQHFGKQCQSVSFATRLAVKLASAFFYAAQLQSDFSLPPFYAQEWKQGLESTAGLFVPDLQTIQRITRHAARFLDADVTTKEFLCELHRLWGDLRHAEHLLIGRALSEYFNPPSVLINGNAAIAINDASEPCKIEFSHGRIVVTVPTACKYFYDAEAVKEPCSESTHDRISQNLQAQASSFWANGGGKTNEPMKTVAAGGTRKMAEAGSGIKANGSFEGACVLPVGSRNKRTVWTVPTEPYPEAHFATFPQDLIKPCILAGTSARGCCPKCGAPWRRTLQPTENYAESLRQSRAKGSIRNNDLELLGTTVGKSNPSVCADYKTVGWKPSCNCFPIEDTPDPVPCTVLDPFFGSGTTGLVAIKLGRKAIGIELNPAYIELAKERCHVTPGLQLA